MATAHRQALPICVVCDVDDPSCSSSECQLSSGGASAALLPHLDGPVTAWDVVVVTSDSLNCQRSTGSGSSWLPTSVGGPSSQAELLQWVLLLCLRAGPEGTGAAAGQPSPAARSSRRTWTETGSGRGGQSGGAAAGRRGSSGRSSHGRREEAVRPEVGVAVGVAAASGAGGAGGVAMTMRPGAAFSGGMRMCGGRRCALRASGCAAWVGCWLAGLSIC